MTTNYVATDDALFIQGDYNTVNKRGSAVIGDAVNLLSNAWDGTKTSGSLPIALNVAREDGLLNEGDKLLVGAFGGGMTWGATVIEWGTRAA